MPGKKIPIQTVTGQQGINLVEKRVLAMGSIWYPTGGYEAGIDGHLELRDPTTGEVLNVLLRVQSKATKGTFEAETASGFDYTCSEGDLTYWLSGNAPVILVRSRPDTDEAYWVSIKDYFRDAVRRKTRKIHFDKANDRFDATARGRLATIGSPANEGIYFAPPPLQETIYSNLLPVTRFPERLYLARTEYRSPRAILEQVAQRSGPLQSEWLLRNKALLSVHDLDEPQWKAVVDAGTVESFDTREWSTTSDPDRARDFVALLNHCLRAKLRSRSIEYYAPKNYYYFTATSNRLPRKVRYKSLAQGAERTVFQAYDSKKRPGTTAYYRHSALAAQFRRYGAGWYLELSPTYHFTSDGYGLHPWYESKLKGIKALERNPTVLGQVVMWADLLADKDSDLFGTVPYPFVGFGDLATFESTVGIEDAIWLPTEEDEATKAAASDTTGLPLFDSAIESQVPDED